MLTTGWYVKKRIITIPNLVSIFLKAWIIGLPTLRCKLCIYIAFEYTPSWEKKGNRYVHIFTLGPNWRSSRWQGKLHLYPGGWWMLSNQNIINCLQDTWVEEALTCLIFACYNTGGEVRILARWPIQKFPNQDNNHPPCYQVQNAGRLNSNVLQSANWNTIIWDSKNIFKNFHKHV